MHPLIAEFIGTAVLLFLGNGVVANVLLKNTKGNGGGWIVITTGWALAVFAGVIIAGPYSGAHLNPAVSVGLALAGKFPWAEVPGFAFAQLLGAMTGGFLVYAMYRDHFKITEAPKLEAACFYTSPAINKPLSNITSEILGTLVLLLSVFYITGAEMGEAKTPIGLGSVGAIPIAFIVWSIGLSLGGPTGYAINPVRDLGPRIIHWLLPLKNKDKRDWRYSWVPVAGPLMGAAIAAGLYLLLHQQ